MKIDQNITKQTLTVEEAAKLLGLSKHKVYQLIKIKALPTVQDIGVIRIPTAKFCRITGIEITPEDTSQSTDVE